MDMKKVLYVFIMCSILIGITTAVYFNPQFIQENAKKIYTKYEEKFGEKIEDYNGDFLINELSVKGNDYYYNTLTDNQKKAYTSIANAVKNLETDVELKNYEYIDEDTTSEDVELVVFRFLLDHPEVFYIDEKYLISTNSNIFTTKVNITFTYLVSSQDELNEKITEISNNMEKIMKNIDENEDDFQKELVIHDYIGKITTYYEYENVEDIPTNCHNIYGALVEKLCVCDGFAKSMKILLNKCNIESILVTGALKDESHEWNLVKLNDKWYNLDLTSDKSITYNKNSYVIHAYFNITDELISKTHTFDNKELLPTANETESNYFIVNNKNIQKLDDFNEKFENILTNNKNEDLLEFSTEYVDVPNKISNVLSHNYYDSEYIDKNSSKFSYYNVLNTYILLKLT
jgi:hypothetical protein